MRTVTRGTWLIVAVVVGSLAAVAVIVAVITSGPPAEPPQVERWRLEVERNPNDMAARLQLGFAYQAAGDNEQALAEYDAVLKQEPRNTAAIYNRAVVLRESGEDKLAEEAFWDVLEIEPEHVGAAAQLGRYYASRNEYRSVLAAVRPVVGVHPESAELQYLTGLAYENLGERSWAIARYRLALKASGDMVEARQGLQRLGVE